MKNESKKPEKKRKKLLTDSDELPDLKSSLEELKKMFEDYKKGKKIIEESRLEDLNVGYDESIPDSQIAPIDQDSISRIEPYSIDKNGQSVFNEQVKNSDTQLLYKWMIIRNANETYWRNEIRSGLPILRPAKLIDIPSIHFFLYLN